jgi:hypothetical protein
LSWTDRICFWRDMKIFAEIEFRQKQIIPFSCSSYFVSESYLTHNTYIFFCLSYWLGNIDSSPKLFVRFEVPPNVKVYVLDITPCTQVPHPHNLTTGRPSIYFLEKEGLLFSPIDHPARPIGGGGSNQKELLASPDSPSPCASLATLLLPVGHAGEA